MSFVELCVFCGGKVEEKPVRVVLAGDKDTVFLTVDAGVCRQCGEPFYGPESVKQMDRITEQLRNKDTSGLRPLGQAFEAVQA